MPDRRQFLVRTGLGFAAAALASTPAWLEDEAEAAAPSLRTWTGVRKQFALRTDLAQLGTFLLASHPAPVRAAIARHRAGLDRNTVEYLHRNEARLEAAVLREAAPTSARRRPTSPSPIRPRWASGSSTTGSMSAPATSS